MFEKDNLQVITEEKDTGLESKVLVGGKDSLKATVMLTKKRKTELNGEW